MLLSSEGLLPYLTADEAEQLVIGVQKVLKEHGGAWISSDFSLSPAVPHDSEAEALPTDSSGESAEEDRIYLSGVAFWNEDRKTAFLESHGLLAEKLPLYLDGEALSALDAVPEDRRASLLSLLKEATVWRMTADPAFTASVHGSKQVQHLIVDYRSSGSKLFFMAKGRIDTISAPILLKIFDRNSNGIAAVTIDATQLEYISSAGLRTLLLMSRKMAAGAVKLIGVSDLVRYMLTSSGLDSIITVK